MNRLNLAPSSAPETYGRDEPNEHRCGQCVGPFGKSAIRCVNEPKLPITVTNVTLEDLMNGENE